MNTDQKNEKLLSGFNALSEEEQEYVMGVINAFSYATILNQDKYSMNFEGKDTKSDSKR